MANLITASRLLLLGLVVAMLYQPPVWWQLLTVPVLIVMFVTDALDGYVARKQGQASQLGAFLDIAADRIVEYVLWIVMAHLHLVSVVVPLIVVVRGTLVDTVRSGAASGSGKQPFDTLNSPLNRWLVGGRFMRIFYAVIKAHAFCWLALIHPLPVLAAAFWANWGWLMVLIGNLFVWTSVVLCLVRGIPVLVEFVRSQRRAS